MRVLRAFAIAFISGLVGLVVAAFAADWLTALYHVSNFEGERAYAVVFLFCPLGLIVGFVVGLIVALRFRAPGFIGFLQAQGLSILSTLALAAVVSGLLYLAADKPPKIEGKGLVLEFEVRIPPSLQLPAEITSGNIHASLYVNNRDNRSAFIDFKSIAKRDGAVVIPGNAALMSHSANRSLLASVEGPNGGTQFLPLKLPAAPSKVDEAWSEWIFATETNELKPIPDAERMAVRYRVKPAEN
jgi:hypothetical protein